jgi:hypothetical protein
VFLPRMPNIIYIYAIFKEKDLYNSHLCPIYESLASNDHIKSSILDMTQDEGVGH